MGPMDTKYDEHRRNALVCLRLSHTTSKVAFRESWLKLAQAWMAMIPPDDSGTTEAGFEDQARDIGTGQKDSVSSH